jgi:hypothetical protein
MLNRRKQYLWRICMCVRLREGTRKNKEGGEFRTWKLLYVQTKKHTFLRSRHLVLCLPSTVNADFVRVLFLRYEWNKIVLVLNDIVSSVHLFHSLFVRKL